MKKTDPGLQSKGKIPSLFYTSIRHLTPFSTGKVNANFLNKEEGEVKKTDPGLQSKGKIPSCKHINFM